MDESQQPEVVLRRMLVSLTGAELQSFVIHTLQTDVATLAVGDVKVDGVWYRVAVRHIPRDQEDI